MKSCVVFFVVIGVVASLGSGPYLPSGWKPKGPAFLLPNEVKSDVSSQENNEGFEGSGTDALREYGPPPNQDIFQAVTRQELPDLYTERAFAAEIKVSEEQKAVLTDEVTFEVRSNVFESVVVPSTEKIGEVTEITTGKSEVVEEDKLITPNVIVEEGVTEVSLQNLSSGTEGVDIITLVTSNGATENNDDTVETTEQTRFAKDDTSALLTNEIIRIEVEDKVASQDLEGPSPKEDDAQSSGNLASKESDIPSSIGFREYGPPKVQSDDRKSESENETRKRRFSSKYTATKKH